RRARQPVPRLGRVRQPGHQLEQAGVAAHQARAGTLLVLRGPGRARAGRAGGGGAGRAGPPLRVHESARLVSEGRLRRGYTAASVSAHRAAGQPPFSRLQPPQPPVLPPPVPHPPQPPVLPPPVPHPLHPPVPQAPAARPAAAAPAAPAAAAPPCRVRRKNRFATAFIVLRRQTYASKW